MLGLGASGAEAATFQVTNLNDDTGAGSLRKAIDDANLAAGADTVQFASGVSGRIELTQALSITDPVTISGPGANQVTVDGNGVGRVFNANFGNAVPAKPVTISGLTLTGGNVVGLNGGAVYAYGADLTLEDMVVTANSAGISGGGVFAGYGQVVIRDSTLSGNDAGVIGGAITVGNAQGSAARNLVISGSTISGNDAPDDGGGLYASNPGGGVLIENTSMSGNVSGDEGGALFVKGPGAVDVVSSTLSGNDAGSGGAIRFKDSTSPKTIVDSTLSGNTANFVGGVYAATSAAGPLSVRNSTISGNDGGIGSGGIYNDSVGGGGNATISSSIVAGNTGGDPDLIDDGAAFFTIGNSLVGPIDGLNNPVQSPSGSNKIGVDPALGPLQDNGGPTLTMAPALSSPAVDAGVSNSLATDQRGLARTVVQPTLSLSPGSDGTDIGAVELAEFTPTPPIQPVSDTEVAGAKVKAKKKQKQKGEKVLIVVKAGAAEDVKIKAGGAVKLGKKKIALKTLSVRAPADEQLKLKLNPKGKSGSKKILKALARGEKAKASLSVTLTDAAGNSVTKKPKVTLTPG